MPCGAQECPCAHLKEILCSYTFTWEESYPSHKFLGSLFSSNWISFFHKVLKFVWRRDFFLYPLTFLNFLRVTHFSTSFITLLTLRRWIVRGVALSCWSLPLWMFTYCSFTSFQHFFKSCKGLLQMNNTVLLFPFLTEFNFNFDLFQMNNFILRLANSADIT
jgi:hypothetical protein